MKTQPNPHSNTFPEGIDELRTELKLLKDRLAVAEEKRIAAEAQLGEKSAALAKTEELFETIYDHSEISTFIVDVHENGEYVFVGINPVHERLIGIRSEELQGKTPKDLIPRLGDPAVNYICDLYDKCVESRSTIESEFNSKFNGRSEWWLSKLTPLLDDTGRVYRIVGNSVIITERKQTEQALADSVDRYNAQFKYSLDIMYVHDLKGQLIDANQSALDALGYTREELPQLKLTDIVEPEDLKRAGDAMADIVSRGNATQFNKYTLIAKDGRKVQVEASGVLLMKDNAPFGVLGVARDITERIKLEEQLRQGEKMQAIGQLAGGIAHDFNNQLCGIIGSADLLSTSLIDAKEKKLVDNILLAAESAAQLTTKLLAFARKGKYITTLVNIHTVIDEVFLLLRHSIPKQVILTTRLEAPIYTTMGDANQIQNALLNLAINARDAMPSGGRLTISTETIDLNESLCDKMSEALQPGCYVKVTVEDTGVGMDDNVKRHLFEPFFSTKKDNNGTGMGLAAVYGTVKNHQGAITVRSAPGEGASFDIYFPATERTAELTSSTLPAGRSEDSAELSKRCKRKHVLVVDDEPAVRESTEHILMELGYRVSLCVNGQDAVDEYRKNWQRIDLVILDVMMPVMDGKTAYKMMSKINPDLKVLMASGFSVDGELQELTVVAQTHFLQKPYRIDDLARQLKKMLG